jgi:hypothetical protein
MPETGRQALEAARLKWLTFEGTCRRKPLAVIDKPLCAFICEFFGLARV